MGTPAAASGKGPSFLLLAGGPVGGQPARPLAAQGRRARGAARCRGRSAGRARAPSGCRALPGEHLTRGGRAARGRVPEPRWPHPKGPASLLGGSSPASAPAPPPSFPSSFTGSPRPPSPSVGLAAPRSRSSSRPPASGRPLVCSNLEPGPAPGEGVAGKLQPGPSTQLLDLREPAKGAEKKNKKQKTRAAHPCGMVLTSVSSLYYPGQPARRWQRWAQPPRLARVRSWATRTRTACGAGSAWVTRVPSGGRIPTSSLGPRPQVESGL